MEKSTKVYVARDQDGIAWVHFARPHLDGDGVWRDGGKTMICRVLPQENLFPNIKNGECMEFEAKRKI